jgi:hypothetical protein
MIVPLAAGPAALYYQSVRGPQTRPVALAELGAHGKLLERVEIRPPVGERECTRLPVVHVSGSTHVLFRAVAPGGHEFTISSEKTRTYGVVGVGLVVTFPNPRRLTVRSSTLRPLPPLEWDVRRLCSPYPYAVVYGLLHAEKDEVLVRSAGKLRVLHSVAPPGYVHLHAAVIYGFVGSHASELLVRTPQGTTVVDEKLERLFAGMQCM